MVAGAAGFVGRALTDRLVQRGGLRVVGLSRSQRASPDAAGVHWRAADLYSLLQAERALSGADVAVYLVHSMMPTSRLTQARFEDLDLILADNFGRAAARAGVQRIVYLGGLVPTGGARSRHLESRREVEDALASHGVPVTAVRAGLVVGRGGSSLAILTSLVRRLPLMVTPAWTRTPTHPIALPDLLRALEAAVVDPRWQGQTLDVGGPEVLTYREMMQRTAAVLGVRRTMLAVPLITPGLSAAWVSLVTGSPRQLVGPLVESLRHPMVARDNRLLDSLGGPRVRFEEALAEAMAPTQRPPGQASMPPPSNEAPRIDPARLVRVARSVQRLPLPHGWDAQEVARAYMRWLPAYFRPFLRVVDRGERGLSFEAIGLPWPLLVLRYAPERSTAERALFYVAGGLLSRRPPAGALRGRLEFRVVTTGGESTQRSVLAAVHDFRPRLPWPLYRWGQAVVHGWVMAAFGRWLAGR